MLEVGLRVVRGPDWNWGNQDNGEGHVGTVVEIGNPDKIVYVKWDSGLGKNNYRVGHEGMYDLRIIDNAQAGVTHPSIICDNCETSNFPGIRYKCTRCSDFDLCGDCYHSEKHDLNHIFQRFDTPSAIGITMPPRKGCAKIPLKGIFIGAKIVRGPDWEWKDQDGGENGTGRVLDIRGWEKETYRSVAKITWALTGTTNVYRIGHKGKVDLTCIEEASGGYYFREHLPILGQLLESIHDRSSNLTFAVGDKVKVLMNVNDLKAKQEDHGGWNPRMEECIGKVGVVHRVTDKGDIRVTYDGCNNRWTFNPLVLTKINEFAVGDHVRVINELAKVKEYQKGHGEWIEVMKSMLGKLGKINKIYSDGDLRVEIESQIWTLNPLCVELVPASASTLEVNNTMNVAPRETHTNPLDSLLSTLMDSQLDVSSMDKLLREAANGQVSVVKDFITKHPNKVNAKINGKTCLQVVCHQGHKELVRLLINANASILLADDDGDTAMHYATFGNQPEIMKMLLEKGADVNAVNNTRCSCLHVAVNKQFIACVQILLAYKCNLDFQDSYGDTALHDAIGKESIDIVNLVCDAGPNFTIKNKRGFNALHHAALKGNHYAVEKILTLAPQLVNEKKDDGFASLHLACLNSHRAVVEVLLSQGQADIDLRNNKQQTPLLLAVSQGNSSVIEMLVGMGANLNATDEEGDTAVHLVLMKRNSLNANIIELEAPTIFGIKTEISENVEYPEALAIACYLVQEGCDFNKRNNKGLTPLDIVDNQLLVVNMLNQYMPIQAVTAATSAVEDCDSPETETRSRSIPVACIVCSELADENVLLQPCCHKIACEDCSARMKKCLQCGTEVTKRVTQDGRIIPCKSRQTNAEQIRYLETKIAEIEEAHFCSICMERRRNIAFLCGHGACENCSTTLRTCHMCRKTITKRINLY